MNINIHNFWYMITPQEKTPLVRLLLDAFPDRAGFPWDCWISESLKSNDWDFAPEIEVATRGGARPDIMRRIREEHPAGRAHREEHDHRILSVFTEVEAFAWAAEVAKMGAPRFVEEAGCPDIRVGEWWIEAKTIERSAATREQDRLDLPVLRSRGFIVRSPVAAQPTPHGLIAKFQSQLDDALKKWDRQARRGGLVVFFNLEKIDFGITRDGTRTAIINWAVRSERMREVVIVLVENWRWRTPLYAGHL